MEEEFINDIDYLDQHFLIDKGVINAFVDAADIKITEDVVEIGPGKCEISDILARRSKHLTCIEIDESLEHYINVLKDKHRNVDVIYGNALTEYIPDCNKIVSALPYYITEPFIEKLLRCNFDSAILIVGKKFADAVNEKKSTKLALLTNSFFKVTKMMDIPPEAFNPKPRVMSSIIKLVPIKRDELNNNFKMFIFRELFFHRDRKLKNDLMESLIEFSKVHGVKLTKKESKKIIQDYNIPAETLDKMIENLSNDEYEYLYGVLE